MTTPGGDVEVSSVDDVQRLYILLQPLQPRGGKCRLLVVAKKRLPDTKRHERFFAFVGEWRAGWCLIGMVVWWGPPLDADSCCGGCTS